VTAEARSVLLRVLADIPGALTRRFHAGI
jgi:hypothetical protein